MSLFVAALEAAFALGSSSMMLTGGIEAADGRTYLSEMAALVSATVFGTTAGTVAADAFRALEAGEPDASGRVQVATAIKRDGQADVSLEYLLQQDQQSWRIINIIADGVSDLALKRAEYQRVFASGGIDGLIAELEQQTQRLSRS